MISIAATQRRSVRALSRLLGASREVASQVPLLFSIPIVIGMLVLAGQVADVPGTLWAT